MPYKPDEEGFTPVAHGYVNPGASLWVICAGPKWCAHCRMEERVTKEGRWVPFPNWNKEFEKEWEKRKKAAYEEFKPHDCWYCGQEPSLDDESKHRWYLYCSNKECRNYRYNKIPGRDRYKANGRFSSSSSTKERRWSFKDWKIRFKTHMTRMRNKQAFSVNDLVNK